MPPDNFAPGLYQYGTTLTRPVYCTPNQKRPLTLAQIRDKSESVKDNNFYDRFVIVSVIHFYLLSLIYYLMETLPQMSRALKWCSFPLKP